MVPNIIIYIYETYYYVIYKYLLLVFDSTFPSGPRPLPSDQWRAGLEIWRRHARFLGADDCAMKGGSPEGIEWRDHGDFVGFSRDVLESYPLVNVYITMENHIF